jgi:hypothetical protein
MVSDAGEVATSVPRGVRARPFNGYGNVLVLRLPGPVWMSFNHLSAFAPGLAPGMSVPKGALLGLVGNTSNGKFRGMGSHLHLEVRHAPTRGGLTPFPGPYGAYNLDPVEWFERNGMTVQGRRLTKVSGCVPAMTARRTGLKGFGELGQVEWKMVADAGAKAPTGTEYEPPRKMAPSIGVVAMSIGMGLGMIGLAKGILLGKISVPFANRLSMPFGHVPEQLFSEIDREASQVKSTVNAVFARGSSYMNQSDCDKAHLFLANGFELLIRASSMSSSDSEDRRIDRKAAKLDELVELLNMQCSE